MLALLRNMEPESATDAPARGDLSIPIEFDHSSRRSLQGQLFEQLCHLTIGWRLKPGYGCPSQPGACQATQYLPQQRVARPQSSDRGGPSPSSQGDRGTYVSLELPETCLVAPTGPSPRRLLRAILPLRLRAPIYRVGTGSGEHGRPLIVLPDRPRKRHQLGCSGSRLAPVELTRDRLSVRFRTQESQLHKPPCHLMYAAVCVRCMLRGGQGRSLHVV